MAHKLPDASMMAELHRRVDRWAERFGTEHVGAEHYILALAEQPGVAQDAMQSCGVVADALLDAVLQGIPSEDRRRFGPADDEALGALGLDLSALRERARDELGDEPSTSVFRSLTPAMVSALWLAEMIAERLEADEVRPEHVLLAMIWQGGSFGTAVLATVVSLVDLRTRILDAMDLRTETRARYLAECMRSERIAAARASILSEGYGDWVTAADVEGRMTAALQDGGILLVSGIDTLQRFIQLAEASRFTVIHNAGDETTRFWVAVNTTLRQVLVALAIVHDDALAGVGVKDLSKHPRWVLDLVPKFPVSLMP